MRGLRTKFKGSKGQVYVSKAKVLRLATQEDEAVAHIPPVARLAPERVEPAPAGIPAHAEEAWVAVRSFNGFHCYG